MFKNYHTYTSPVTLPIWNWWQVDEKKDLRYLFILNDYSKLPKLNGYRKLQLAYHYKELLMQFDNIKSPLMEARNKILIRIIDIVLSLDNTMDPEHLQRCSTILRGLMISSDPDIGWIYKNMDMLERPDQKQLVTHLAIEINKYQEKKQKQSSKAKADIYEQLARIQAILSINIDIRKCSVLEWMAYQKEALSKVNIGNKVFG